MKTPKITGNFYLHYSYDNYLYGICMNEYIETCKLQCILLMRFPSQKKNYHETVCNFSMGILKNQNFNCF